MKMHVYFVVKVAFLHPYLSIESPCTALALECLFQWEPYAVFER